MISKLFAALLALCCSPASCLAADKPVTDDTINDQVRIKLASDPEVKGGALEGGREAGRGDPQRDGGDADQKDKAAKLAKKVKGVKQVVNNIEIKARDRQMMPLPRRPRCSSSCRCSPRRISRNQVRAARQGLRLHRRPGLVAKTAS